MVDGLSAAMPRSVRRSANGNSPAVSQQKSQHTKRNSTGLEGKWRVAKRVGNGLKSLADLRLSRQAFEIAAIAGAPEKRPEIF